METIHLLDVNVLVAAAWPTHRDHEKVQACLARHARGGWATLAHPPHEFWTDDIGLVQAFERLARNLRGHQQVIDAYLLGLAIHKKGKLVTMDRAVRTLLPEKGSERDIVVLL